MAAGWVTLKHESENNWNWHAICLRKGEEMFLNQHAASDAKKRRKTNS